MDVVQVDVRRVVRLLEPQGGRADEPDLTSQGLQPRFRPVCRVLSLTNMDSSSPSHTSSDAQGQCIRTSCL